MVALYIGIPQIGSFHDSLKLWKAVQWSWVLMAGGVFAASYFLAASIYMALSLRPLRYGRTVLVQLAAMFAGRLLPAGVGALSVDYRYMRYAGHSQAEAGTIVALNNALGVAAHILLLVLLAVGGGFRHQDLNFTMPPYLLYGLLGAPILLAIGLLIEGVRNRILRLVRQAFKVIHSYRRRPAHLATALTASGLLTTAYTLTLYGCAHALGLHVSVIGVFIGMTIGVVGATVTPTPGGIGGAEAGVVGGLIFAGLSAQASLTTALLYRLITFWLPLVVGAVAFAIVRRHQYI